MVFKQTPRTLLAVLTFYANRPVQNRAVNQVVNVMKCKEAEMATFNILPQLAAQPMGISKYLELMTEIENVSRELLDLYNKEKVLRPDGQPSDWIDQVLRTAPSFDYNVKGFKGIWEYFKVATASVADARKLDRNFSEQQSILEILALLVRIGFGQRNDEQETPKPPDVLSPAAKKKIENRKAAKEEEEKVEKEGAIGVRSVSAERETSSGDIPATNPTSKHKKSKKRKASDEITDLTGDSASGTIIDGLRASATRAKAEQEESPDVGVVLARYMTAQTDRDLHELFSKDPFAAVWSVLRDEDYHLDGKSKDIKDALKHTGCKSSADLQYLAQMPEELSKIRAALKPVAVLRLNSVIPQQ